MLRGGEVIEATDVIFGPSRVSYKLFSEPSGSMYFVDTDRVARIYFENGQTMNLLPSPVLTSGRRVSYSELKNYYNYKFYQPQAADPYDPVWLGVASGIVPGLGQCLEGEWGTGILMFLGSSAAIYTTAKTFRIRDYSTEDLREVHEVQVSLGSLFFLGCAVALDALSVIDAVKIAKVKNMYYQDIREPLTAASLHLEPFFALTTTPATPSGAAGKAVSGLSLKLDF